MVTTNESIPDRLLRVQHTRNFHELSGTLKSNERYQRLQIYNELWLEEVKSTIKVQDIICHVNVWIKDDDDARSPTFEFSIQEIIYIFNSHQKVRHISL